MKQIWISSRRAHVILLAVLSVGHLLSCKALQINLLCFLNLKHQILIVDAWSLRYLHNHFHLVGSMVTTYCYLWNCLKVYCKTLCWMFWIIQQVNLSHQAVTNHIFSHHGNGLCYHRDVSCNGTPCPTTPNGTVCGDISIYDILKDWNELHLFNGDTLPEGHIRRPTQVLQIAVMVESNFGTNE